MTNQTPEQTAREQIDQMLHTAGWQVQSKKEVDLSAGLGVAVREYQTSVGPADYVLFVVDTRNLGEQAEQEFPPSGSLLHRREVFWTPAFAGMTKLSERSCSRQQNCTPFCVCPPAYFTSRG